MGNFFNQATIHGSELTAAVRVRRRPALLLPGEDAVLTVDTAAVGVLQTPVQPREAGKTGEGCMQTEPPKLTYEAACEIHPPRPVASAGNLAQGKSAC